MGFKRLSDGLTNSIASYCHSLVTVSLTFLFHSSCFQVRMAWAGQVMSCVIQINVLIIKLIKMVSVHCNVSHTGTDVMLLDNFSTDGSSHPQHHGNPSGKRRSSVTFEDQVEHAKGICHSPLFGEDLGLPGGLFMTRATPRPRYLDGQRLRLESIDEGIVKDDREDEEQDVEEKPA